MAFALGDDTIIDLTINGEEVMVVRNTHPVYLKRGRYDIFLDLCEGFVFSITGDDRDKRYTIAGYDTNKIDWAYPQEVLDDDCVVKKIRSGDRLCWSYDGDLIDHKLNGYLAEPFISADLAEGISWVLNSAHPEMLAQNAREKVLRCFDSKVVAQQYIELYQSVIK